MSQLSVKNNLPLGIAWLWIKASFAIFREKPINFMFFALMFVVFSLLPFMGAFFATLIIVRMLISAQSIENEQEIGIGLNLKEIFAKRNVVSFAIFSVAYDLISMGIMKQIMSSLGIDNATPETMITNHNLVYMMIAMSLLRAFVFGISTVIITFNPEVRVFDALKLSWSFILQNFSVIVLGLLVLIPFILVPMYLLLMVTLAVSSNIIFGILLFFLGIVMLLFIIITTLFTFKMYQSGISHE